METIPVIIQIVGLTSASLFMLYIFRLIVRGKLREEYSIVWILCTVILIVFSIWRRGLELISLALGVYYPPSLVFLAAIFAIIVFLVHLSVVISRLQSHIKSLTHEMAYLKQELAQLKTQDEQTRARTSLLTES
jgi:hypothetical protein